MGIPAVIWFLFVGAVLGAILTLGYMKRKGR